jgi:hypothetical protein
MAGAALDEAKLEAFIEKVMGDAAATAHAATVVLGGDGCARRPAGSVQGAC